MGPGTQEVLLHYSSYYTLKHNNFLAPVLWATSCKHKAKFLTGYIRHLGWLE